MSTTITRACEHAGVFYKVGDTVPNHDTAEMLVEFGYAKTDKTASADPAAAANTAGNGKKES